MQGHFFDGLSLYFSALVRVLSKSSEILDAENSLQAEQIFGRKYFDRVNIGESGIRRREGIYPRPIPLVGLKRSFVRQLHLI